MNKLSTWLVILFMAMFWLIRVVAAFTSSIGIDMGMSIPNMNYEIVLLFITLLSMILIVKRKMLGGLIYLVSYLLYFGPALFNTILGVMEGSFDVVLYTNLLIYFVAIIIPFGVLFDLLFDKNKQKNPKDKKTDWFYKNENYDREVDERADKNNYRTL